MGTGGGFQTALIGVRAALYGAGFVLLWGWLSEVVQPWDRSLGLAIPAAAVPAGAILMLAGSAIVIACVGVFVAFGRGTAAPFDPPRVFVAIGPYRFVRNPMYIGAWFVLAGWALVRRSPAILLLSLGMLLVFHLFVLLVEEPGLERRFGESYREYRSRTSRWIPRLSPATS